MYFVLAQMAFAIEAKSLARVPRETLTFFLFQSLRSILTLYNLDIISQSVFIVKEQKT
jgi:hypothetical protein